MNKIIRFFDKLEDRVRGRLSKYPIIYAILGGSAIILFWRGIWHATDELEAYYGFTNLEGAALSALAGALILLLTGLFVSFFVGDAILISGIKKEKKLIEKTEDEVGEEVDALKVIHREVSKEEAMLIDMRQELAELKRLVNKQILNSREK